MISSEIIHVREAVRSDWETCLFFERLDEYGRNTVVDESIIKSHISMGAIFLAECDDCAIGYASLNFLYASRTPLLSWWYVDPAYRGKGVGSLLLREVERHLTEIGMQKYLISACREIEINRHRISGLPEVGFIQLAENEFEIFFMKVIG